MIKLVSSEKKPKLILDAHTQTERKTGLRNHAEPHDALVRLGHASEVTAQERTGKDAEGARHHENGSERHGGNHDWWVG